MDSGEWPGKERAPHTPVMLQEVLEWLRIRPDGIYVDATLGAGGHSEAIAESLTLGRLISLDRDAQALEIAQERLKRFGSKVNCVLSPFSRIVEAVHELGIPKVDGVLADLGVSSMQLDQAERGFSFREAGPLSMRMGVNAEDETLTADEIVNRWPENDMADLFYREADEHDSRRIARAIVAGSRKQWGRQRLHPATKTFLALRIAVNREMEELGQFLSRVPATMNPEGRCVLLTYHSREDRLVKEAFREAAKQGTLKILTKHVMRPSEEEERANPRSRSAKLRCAERV
jgi:16S rRNA (cytosine1402-N4)-methyltransferase